LIDFQFQWEDFEEKVDMAYHLRSEDECQQAEDSEARSGRQFRPTHSYIVENQLLIYDEGQSWVSYILVWALCVGFEPYVIRSWILI